MLGTAHINERVATRAYDTSNGFELHLAQINIKHQLNENVYGFIAFNAGADAALNHDTSGTTTTLFDVPEAYAVATGDGFTFTGGKFTTYEGIDRALWANSHDVVQWILGSFSDQGCEVVDASAVHPTDVFFVEELLVPPSCFRPVCFGFALLLLRFLSWEFLFKMFRMKACGQMKFCFCVFFLIAPFREEVFQAKHLR